MEIREIPPNLAKFHISPHILCGKIWNSSACGEMSNFSTSVMHWNLKFLHMTDFSPPIYRWSRWQIWGMQRYRQVEGPWWSKWKRGSWVALSLCQNYSLLVKFVWAQQAPTDWLTTAKTGSPGPVSLHIFTVAYVRKAYPTLWVQFLKLSSKSKFIMIHMISIISWPKF